ncbi:sigma-70 family RNA polymerase sigma factor [Methylobacterium nonmethylotrophicum]|uniref:RNA polymerase sigma factor n=2 Tax=Methylobacterium nonmethylotrophicum TaxID=1141884 RepID=A0A4Z0NI95_9HYPH|nr:sigma-70 family RNA polymerase sigma factor [Methylobacterium nonmethylotrophicum]
MRPPDGALQHRTQDETGRPAGTLSAQTRDHLGEHLQALYGFVLTETHPEPLLALVARLDAALAVRSTADADDFRRNLTDVLPRLRTFALSLTVNAAQADDLVQETVLKAWVNQHRFTPGTNLAAWLCTILRNQFYTECRRRRREVEDVDGAAAGDMIALPEQEHGIDLQKVWQAMTALPPTQRQALMLVGAQGLTYEAAATLIGCQVGTVKSRVSRARSFLASRLAVERT